jgi:hypothetical protein
MRLARVSFGVLLVVGLGTTAVSATSASAATTGVVAKFGNGTMDMSQGWGAAKACLVWQQGGVVECFATRQELEAREAQLRPAGPASTTAAAPDTSCASSLDLYTGANYTGNQLDLWDIGVWQNLADYGFDNVTVSFVGGACAFHLAQNANGGGYWYPGYTGAYGASPNMGSWDDTVSSVYIV